MRRRMVAVLVGSALAIAGMAADKPARATPASSIVPSPDMSVAAFLLRVNQLRQNGPEWPLSPEAGELFAAITAVGKDYRQALAEKRAAGQPAEACLPPEAEIESDVLLAHFAAYTPEAAVRTSIREAFSQLVRERFPCP